MTSSTADGSSSNDRILLFVKAGRRDHMEALLYQGIVYANTISWFAKKAAEEHRQDSWEGSTKILQERDRVRILVDDIDINFNGAVRLYHPKNDPYRATHLFCVSNFSENQLRPGAKIVNEAMKKFGDWAVVIHNTASFIDRLHSSKLSNPCSSIATGPVSYVSNDYSGDYSIFHKPQKYEWQREFRIVFSAPSSREEPIKFELGPLEDIAFIVELSKMKNRVELHPDGIALCVK